MRIRLVASVLVLLALPALTQQPNLPARNAMWVNRDIRPEPPRNADLQAARIKEIHQDAEQLSLLNAALQSDLQQLQKGMLPKDLADNLKKVEKLSKKLRQEVAR
jgi:hypothetical protein